MKTAFRPLIIVPALVVALVFACGKGAGRPGGDAAAHRALTGPVGIVTPPAAVKAPPADFTGRVQAAVDKLAAELGAAQTKPFLEALAQGGEKPHDALATVSFIGQNLERAAWLYGLGVLAEPNNDVYLNNFGLCLHEKALLMRPKAQGGPGAPGPAPETLTLARESLEQAVTLKGDRAAYHSNLGVTLLEIWRSTGDAATLEAAVAALKKAAALDPKSATAWAHLAEALAAQGDMAGAAAALEKSRALGPYNGALMSARTRMPQAVNDEYNKHSPRCKVNYDCKGKCPKSIIGQITLVTCEMEQSSSQMACEAGKPYAEGFDCSEQIPKFGILIPGLNSGLSFITPWGRLDAVVDGRGNVDFKFKPGTSVGGVGVSLETRGSWSPSSGFTSVEVKPGVSYNLLGGDAAKMCGDVKMGPASISADVNLSTGQTTTSVKAYGGTVLSH